MFFKNHEPSKPITMDYILEHEKIKFELDEYGRPWAIFESSWLVWEYDELIGGFCIGNWNGYENCVLLQNTIGL